MGVRAVGLAEGRPALGGVAALFTTLTRRVLSRLLALGLRRLGLLRHARPEVAVLGLERLTRRVHGPALGAALLLGFALVRLARVSGSGSRGNDKDREGADDDEQSFHSCRQGAVSCSNEADSERFWTVASNFAPVPALSPAEGGRPQGRRCTFLRRGGTVKRSFTGYAATAALGAPGRRTRIPWTPTRATTTGSTSSLTVHWKSTARPEMSRGAAPSAAQEGLEARRPVRSRGKSAATGRAADVSAKGNYAYLRCSTSRPAAAAASRSSTSPTPPPRRPVGYVPSHPTPSPARARRSSRSTRRVQGRPARLPEREVPAARPTASAASAWSTSPTRRSRRSSSRARVTSRRRTAARATACRRPRPTRRTPRSLEQRAAGEDRQGLRRPRGRHGGARRRHPRHHEPEQAEAGLRDQPRRVAQTGPTRPARRRRVQPRHGRQADRRPRRDARCPTGTAATSRST